MFITAAYRVKQAVGDATHALCQAVTELAVEENAPVTVSEFRTLNRCLDNAIADAVTEYAAMLAVGAVKSGNVGLAGATGAVLDRSLKGMRDLIDRPLAEVRLKSGLPTRRERISLGEFTDEVQVAAVMEAKSKGLGFTVELVEQGLAVDADRHMLSSAVSNLLQNAFKFTHPPSRQRFVEGLRNRRSRPEVPSVFRLPREWHQAAIFRSC